MREAAQLERNGAIKNACMGNVKRKCHRWDNNIKVDVLVKGNRFWLCELDFLAEESWSVSYNATPLSIISIRELLMLCKMVNQRPVKE